MPPMTDPKAHEQIKTLRAVYRPSDGRFSAPSQSIKDAIERASVGTHGGRMGDRWSGAVEQRLFRRSGSWTRSQAFRVRINTSIARTARNIACAAELRAIALEWRNEADLDSGRRGIPTRGTLHLPLVHTVRRRVRPAIERWSQFATRGNRGRIT